jgi:hypothetical protein
MFTTFVLAAVLSSAAELAGEVVAGSDSCLRWEIAEIDMVFPKRLWPLVSISPHSPGKKIWLTIP